MLETLTHPPKDTSHPQEPCRDRDGTTTGTLDGLRTIAINVIGLTGYGTRQPWAQAARSSTPPAGHKLTFMEALLAIVNNHIISVFIPSRILTLSFMPPNLRTLGHATSEFPQYAREMIAHERASRSGSTRNSLLSALVQAADDPKQNPFSEDEIVGNLFNFTLAGFDTTASTMAYAVLMLAIEPELQEWIGEEIDRVGALHPSATYETTFPLLVRCLALMVSSLLHPKHTGTPLSYSNRTVQDGWMPGLTLGIFSTKPSDSTPPSCTSHAVPPRRKPFPPTTTTPPSSSPATQTSSSPPPSSTSPPSSTPQIRYLSVQVAGSHLPHHLCQTRRIVKD